MSHKELCAKCNITAAEDKDLLIQLRQEQCATFIETPDLIPGLELEAVQELCTATSEIIDANTSVEVSRDITITQTIVEVTPTAPSPRLTPAPARLSAQPTDSSVPEIRKGVLRELGLKSAELSPTKPKLYFKCKRHLREIMMLRKQLKKHPRTSLPKLLADEDVKSLMNTNISGSLALLLQNKLTNITRTKTVRSWSVDDKVMALSIYKQSPACYRLLRRLFCLPRAGTLKGLLNKIPMECGINPQIFDKVEDITSKRDSEDNLCILAFDEMKIRKNVSYNRRGGHGVRGGTVEPASHALLFMAIGIRKNWKQPLAFYFSCDRVAADRLSALIEEVLAASLRAGLAVAATVCEGRAAHIEALHWFGSSLDHPYFCYKGHEIVTIVDPPHLMKCFRNNFLNHDIECTLHYQNGGKPIKGVARWDHIKQFYDKDNGNPNFVFAPALNKQHIEPNFKQKNKVSLACQVFSHSVAVGMFAKIANNELPQEAMTTALLIVKMDQLFDALNGDTRDRKRGKKFLTNLTRRSPHLDYFKEMKMFFSQLIFVGATEPPSVVRGFLRTLNAVERLYNHLDETFQIESLSTRRLSGDPLENCFGCIRSNCGSDSNPDTVQFVAALKCAIIGNSLHSSRNKNCEDDNNVILIDFKSFLNK